VWSFQVRDKATPEEVRHIFRFEGMKNFGINGMFEQDDMDNWNQCVASGKSPMARRYLQDTTMGVAHEFGSNWAPGTLAQGTNETPQRGLYRRWREFMAANNWKEIPIEPIDATYEGTATFKG